MKTIVLLFNIFICVYSCSKNADVKLQTSLTAESKDTVVAKFDIKGVSFVAENWPIEEENISALERVNCNWIAQSPFAFGALNSPNLKFDPINSWWGESDLGVTTTTQLARIRGIKTMLKPQLWLRGSYTGDFTLSSENDWQIWEQDYFNYMMHHAKLANELNIEMLCIGTEMRLTIKNRPVFWNNLIDEIRKVYRGKLIYAANWDDYQEVTFWEKLDYIGINGYFPLSNSTTPSVAEIVKNWQPIINNIDNYRKNLNKEVIFTEIGYKSLDQAAYEPWNPISKTVNIQAQSNAFRGFFEAFANKKTWFMGAFLWKWYPKNETAGGLYDTDYTPQNKPSEKIIKKCF
jgi:hypothetical protein